MSSSRHEDEVRRLHVIVISDAEAYDWLGWRRIVNFSRHSPQERRRKMNLAIELFKSYGWFIEDRRGEILD